MGVEGVSGSSYKAWDDEIRTDDSAPAKGVDGSGKASVSGHIEPDWDRIGAAIPFPTGLVATAPRATLATVQNDLKDVRTKAAAVAKDLQSPELLELAKKDAAVYKDYVAINALVVSLVGVAFAFAEKPTVTAASIFALYKATDAVKLVPMVGGILDDHRAAQAAGKAAHPAIEKLLTDLVALQGSVAKLTVDSNSFAHP